MQADRQAMSTVPTVFALRVRREGDLKGWHEDELRDRKADPK
jgi:hypothetical protein